MFIMEGDTPSFLGLIANGLNAQDKPNWGGWGGRYLLRQPAGESHKIWTQGGDAFMRVTSADTVGDHTSDQATIWRWRASPSGQRSTQNPQASHGNTLLGV